LKALCRSKKFPEDELTFCLDDFSLIRINYQGYLNNPGGFTWKVVYHAINKHYRGKRIDFTSADDIKAIDEIIDFEMKSFQQKLRDFLIEINKASLPSNQIRLIQIMILICEDDHNSFRDFMNEVYEEAEKVGISKDNVRQILGRLRSNVKGNSSLRDTMSFITFDPLRGEIIDLFLNGSEEQLIKYKVMLTRKEFENQWNRDFAGLAPLAGEQMPSYDEYRISERMLEDYLDIFRGFNSREEGMEMPYPHPFFDENGNLLLKEKPCIKYILIGEARPHLNTPISLNKCGGDEDNTYFYNKTHIGKTPWLSAPRLNWGCPPYAPCPINKVDTLLCLASKGVLLLDLFPFAIPYGGIRNLLNTGGVTRSYWDDIANPYSLSNRITAIQRLLCNDWDLSLIAPCIISGFIINPINAFPAIAAVPVGIHPAQFRTLMPDRTRCPLGEDYRKVAVTSAGSPSRNLINVSF
jgi:hypothetical protein